MKFQQLPVGARFEYEGAIYSKTGPISATADAGGTRMIPRHADLRPLDVASPPPKRPGRKLDEAVVLAAFEEFYRASLESTEENSRLTLAAARQRFLDALA